MSNNTRVATYDIGTLEIRSVLDKFNEYSYLYDIPPEDRGTIYHVMDLFEEIERRGSKALLDISVDYLITLEMNVNYIRVNMYHANEAFEMFYQLLANIRMIKQHCDLDRIIDDCDNIRYGYVDTDMTKELFDQYFNDRDNEKIIKTTTVAFSKDGLSRNRSVNTELEKMNKKFYNNFYGVRRNSGRYPWTEYKEEEKMIKPVKVIYNDMSATVFFNDGTKTTVTCTEKDKYDEDTAIALAYTKRMLGSNANGQWQKSMQVVRQSPKFDNRLLKDRKEFIKLSTDIEWFGYELGMWSKAHCIKQLSRLVYNICNNHSIEFCGSDYQKVDDLIDMIRCKYDDASIYKLRFKLRMQEELVAYNTTDVPDDCIIADHVVSCAPEVSVDYIIPDETLGIDNYEDDSPIEINSETLGMDSHEE